jgi:hypothetical protein
LKEGDLDILTPCSNNLHAFEALENISFLDVLIPNYDFENIYCNFYQQIEGNKKLKFRTSPEDYIVQELGLKN